ncbi:MAG: NAD(P)-binding protein [Planctomycetaceae bacterium]
MANKAELNVTVIDLNRNGVRKGMDMGFEGLVGDATQHEVLEHAHVAEAKVVVVTIPSLRMAIAVVDMIRSQAPQTHIVVRARYLRDIHELYAAGADIVFDDEEEIGHSIGQHLSSWILHQSGLSRGGGIVAPCRENDGLTHISLTLTNAVNFASKIPRKPAARPEAGQSGGSSLSTPWNNINPGNALRHTGPQSGPPPDRRG